MTAHEESRLAIRARTGCAASRDRLILAHLGLVVAISQRYRNCGIGSDDLAAEGTLGLVRAIDRFDPGRGTRLAVYAAHWIRLAIREALNGTTGTIRLPDHMVRLMARWRREAQRLARESDGRVVEEAVAEALRLGPRKLRLARAALKVNRMRFASQTIASEDPVDHHDDPGRDEPMAAMIRAEEIAELRRWLACLETHERLVLGLRMGLDGAEPHSLAEISLRVGCSGEWVRKTEIRAIGRLARWMGGSAPPRRPGRANSRQSS